jgi:hypothetical protein
MCFSKVTFVKIPTKKEKITMKTRMKKLISISTIPVLALALLLVLGTVMADNAAKPAPSLRFTTDYWWVRENPPAPFPGHWEGTISGDIDGYIIWPGGGGMRFAGQTSHYVGSFEIYDLADNLILVGEGAGSTTVRHGRDSIWRSNGIVTGSSDEFADWIGCRVHQDGHFTWAAPGVPEAGYGTFRVN